MILSQLVSCETQTMSYVLLHVLLICMYVLLIIIAVYIGPSFPVLGNASSRNEMAWTTVHTWAHCELVTLDTQLNRSPWFIQFAS